MEQYSECAVIVTSPREEFSHSHSLRSDFDGAVNCITYDAINQAYLDAMKRIGASPVEDIPPPPEIADIALVLLEVTQQLAKQYNLNQEDVELGLAQVDTLKTAIREICPAYLYSITCHAGKYRRHDGICTNIEHPSWGATNTVFTRLIPPQFSDLVSSPRVSLSGAPLPPARIVSRTIHEDIGFHDHAGTTMLIAWGQFMDHDLTLMGMPLDPINRNEVRSCCDTPPSQQNPYCFEIEIPRDDYFYRKFNIRCQDFVRSFPGVRPDCKLGPRNPFNTLTAAIDGNTVYGVNAVLARQLRTLQGGLLKMNPAFTELNLKDLLPPKVDIPDEGCVRTNFTQFCFLAGEIRVNEQLILSCIHTLMAREHNRIARELSAINPHWEDEIVYEETRRIVIAEIQHITFNELLPIVLGKHTMEKYGLLLNPKGYWDGYDPETNIGILDAFAAAAFRFGHSLLPTSVERWSKVHKFIASRRLSNLIRQPFDLYRAGVIDEYILGLTNQAAQAMDDSVTQEVTNNLFKRAGNRFGLDLIAFNIQRGREFGLPGYMFYRERCGLRTSFTFDEMIGTMPNLTIQRYSTIYESPWDIDLWSAGAAELPMHGSLVGPTFACIIANQFKLARHGDRFWYELPNQPSSFTEDQLREIKKIRLSRIICDNTDLVETIQIYAMVLPDLSINPRVSCKSSVLPSIDLSHWRDGPEAEEVFADVSNFNGHGYPYSSLEYLKFARSRIS
ncbi:chorion peroxidase-like isoform X2 [Planococcus citri]